MRKVGGAAKKKNERARGVYLFVEGRGFHVEGEGTMSRIEGKIFFFQFFFLKR